MRQFRRLHQARAAARYGRVAKPRTQAKPSVRLNLERIPQVRWGRISSRAICLALLMWLTIVLALQILNIVDARSERVSIAENTKPTNALPCPAFTAR